MKFWRSTGKPYLMPPEHGGWFLWLGPFVLGALAAAQFRPDLLLLLLLLAVGYLLRQPLIIMVKALAGRRARADFWRAARVFLAAGAVPAFLLLVLLLRGHDYLLWLGLPALPVLALQLWLVSRRQERQVAIELIGSGVLALAAPGAYWVASGGPSPEGWWLWALSWFYNGSAVIYVYLRLRQRRWSEIPTLPARLRSGARALTVAVLNLTLSSALALLGLIPLLAILAYLLALLHYIYGAAVPAVRARPARIGFEQSAATLLFFVLLALAYRA